MSSLPQEFISKIQFFFPAQYGSKVTGFTPRPVSLRPNLLKVSDSQLEEILTKLEVNFTKFPNLEHCYQVPQLEKEKLTKSQEYNDGLFYIQSISSMLPALVLDPQEGENILDLCAAPGSKTTQIAALMKNTGKILANDISRERIYRLKGNLRIQGVTNTHVIQKPGQKVWQKFPEIFDRVLLDAPCSLEGRFQEGDVESISSWSPKEVFKLSQRQKWLLRSAFSSVKPGGLLIYSTCTLSPEENEEVVAWLLATESGKATLEEVSLDKIPMVDGLVKTSQDLPSTLALTKRIFPDGNFEGFFVAKIRKTSSSVDLTKLQLDLANPRERKPQRPSFLKRR